MQIQLVQKGKCAIDFAGQKVTSLTREWKGRILSGQWDYKTEFYLGQNLIYRRHTEGICLEMFRRLPGLWIALRWKEK